MKFSLLCMLFIFSFSILCLPLSATSFSSETAEAREKEMLEFVGYYISEASADPTAVVVEVDGMGSYQEARSGRNDWNVFAEKAKLLFGEDLLYAVLYHDNVREKDGKLLVTSVNSAWKEGKDLFREAEQLDYSRIVTVDDLTCFRYTPYALVNPIFTEIYGVDLWEYDEGAENWIMLATNRYRFSILGLDTDNELYRAGKYYPEYDGEYNDASALFYAYATAVKSISGSFCIFNLYNDPLSFDRYGMGKIGDDGYVYACVDDGAWNVLLPALESVYSPELAQRYLANNNVIICPNDDKMIGLKNIQSGPRYSFNDLNVTLDVIDYDDTIIKVTLGLPEYDSNGDLVEIDDSLVIIENGRIVYEEYSGMTGDYIPDTGDRNVIFYFICCVTVSVCLYLLCKKRSKRDAK